MIIKRIKKTDNKIRIKKNQRYSWCTCRNSKNYPICDGSHKGTEFSPIIVDNLKEGNIAWCGCKCSKNSPYCDGAHSKL